MNIPTRKHLAFSAVVAFGYLCAFAEVAHADDSHFLATTNLDSASASQPGAIKTVDIAPNGAKTERTASLPYLELDLNPLIGGRKAQLTIEVKPSTDAAALLPGSNADYVVADMWARNTSVSDPMFALGDCRREAENISSCILTLSSEARFTSPEIVAQVRDALKRGVYTNIGAQLRIKVRQRATTPGQSVRASFRWTRTIESRSSVAAQIGAARQRIERAYGSQGVPHVIARTFVAAPLANEIWEPCGFWQPNHQNNNDPGVKDACHKLEKAPTNDGRIAAYARLRAAMADAWTRQGVLAMDEANDVYTIRTSDDPAIADGVQVDLHLYDLSESTVYSDYETTIDVTPELAISLADHGA